MKNTQKKVLSRPDPQFQKQAWINAAKNFSMLDQKLVTLLEDERIKRDKTKTKTITYFPNQKARRVHIFILMSICNGRDLSSSDLAKAWGVEDAAICRVIENLIKSEYVAKKANHNDQRRKDIILTDNGRKFLNESLNIYSNLLSKEFKNLA